MHNYPFWFAPSYGGLKLNNSSPGKIRVQKAPQLFAPPFFSTPIYKDGKYVNATLTDGILELDAHLTVSKLLGHERADVTSIYLASLKGNNIF